MVAPLIVIGRRSFSAGPTRACQNARTTLQHLSANCLLGLILSSAIGWLCEIYVGFRGDQIGGQAGDWEESWNWDERLGSANAGITDGWGELDTQSLLGSRFTWQHSFLLAKCPSAKMKA